MQFPRLLPALGQRRIFARESAVVVAVLFLLLGDGTAALAQAPANDNVANAQTLTGQSGRLTGTNVNATRETGEPVHPLNAGGKSVWYQWTAAVSGSMRFDTVGTGFDTILAVYTNSPGGLRLIGGTDNPNTGFIDTSGGYLESRVNLANPPVGRTYFIAVDGFNAGSAAASGPVVLNWNQVVNAPANDNFGSATVLTGAQGGVSGRNHNASKENNEPNHAGNAGGRSVWFRWTVPAGGDAVIDTMGSTLDTLLGVYTGTGLNGLTLVATNNDIVPDDPDGDGIPYIGFSRVTFRAVSGTTYRIAVDGFAAGTGSISLHYYLGSSAPTNDNFATAVTLNGGKGTIAGSNLSSTREPGEPGHSISAGGRSVWYQWTAPTNGQATFDTFGLLFDSVLAVYTGNTVGGLGLVTANDDIVPGFVQSSRASFAATAGTTYRIVVDGFSNSMAGATADFSPFTLNWELAANAPTNDVFGQARLLPGNSGSLTTSNSTAVFEASEPLHGPLAGKSLWFKWTAARDHDCTIHTLGSSFDTLLAIYTGSELANLLFIAGNDDADAFTNGSRATFPAVSGTTYFIAVDGYNPGNGRGAEHGIVQLHWSQPGDPPPNDHFTNTFILAGLAGSTNGASWGATIEPDEPDRGAIGAAASSWFRWTAPVSGWFTFDTRGSALDTVLGLYTGASFVSFTEIGANDNLDDLTPVLQSRVTFRATNGMTYHIAVDGAGGAQGDFVLNWSPTVALSVAINAGHLFVTVKAADGNSCFIQGSSNLVEWTNLQSVNTAASPVTVDLGPVTALPHRFFRTSQ